MPALPTLTVTQAQLDRATAAFGDAATYKAWLKDTLKEEVARREIAPQADAIRAEVYGDLGSAS
jgi:hypothetical protein